MKRLVIAPHCDDETLGCGGLIAKYPGECGVVVITEPTPEREKEFTRAREVLGYEEFEFLGLVDGDVGRDKRLLVDLLDGMVSRFKPRELYLPFPSMHQDHIATYEAGIRAGRLSMTDGHHFTPSLYVYDVTAYDVVMYPSDLRWNVFESLTEDQIDLKVEALAVYDSQTVVGPHPVNSIKQQAGVVGNARQVAWAEAYALVRDVRP